MPFKHKSTAAPTVLHDLTGMDRDAIEAWMTGLIQRSGVTAAWTMRRRLFNSGSRTRAAASLGENH